jgi:nicotinamide-nucleotide amidase
MIATLISIGDELLIGQTINTNAAWLGEKLSEMGIEVNRAWTIGDTYGDIKETISQAETISDLILITGGLGPTKDDITRKALADYMGVGMVFHEASYERIVKIFARLGRPVSMVHKEQCLMPEGAEILRNSMGTAPGMLFRRGDTIIISMPGVPYEMKAIMEEEVIPILRGMAKIMQEQRTILTCGTGETVLENQISDIVENFPENVSIAYLPSPGQVKLRVTARGADQELQVLVDRYMELIAKRIEAFVYGFGKSSLEQEIRNIAAGKNIRVATAESCTGGAVGASLVSIAGSSAYFQGSITAYSNSIKTDVLNVSTESLQKYGAVSEEVVCEMVDGVLSLLHVDAAVAVSGIAGPDGGSEEKPVGTIWICAGSRSQKTTYLLRAGKDRTRNIELAKVYALNQLRLLLLSM